MRTLKEEVYLVEYESTAEAIERIGTVLEDVYDQKCLHSAIGYVPPAEFEQSLRQPKLALLPVAVQGCSSNVCWRKRRSGYLQPSEIATAKMTDVFQLSITAALSAATPSAGDWQFRSRRYSLSKAQEQLLILDRGRWLVACDGCHHTRESQAR